MESNCGKLFIARIRWFTMNLSLKCCKSINVLMARVATFCRSFFPKPSRHVWQELKNGL